MTIEVSGADLDALVGMSFEEHAPLVAGFCGVIIPIFTQFEAKVNLYQPNDAELVKWADYAQLGLRKLKEAFEASLGDAMPM